MDINLFYSEELSTMVHNLWLRIESWPFWKTFLKFTDSNFFNVLIGSSAGAFAGALAAQRIADRNKLREEFIKEIRNINVAITLSYSLCNIAMQLKKQNVTPMLSVFYDQFQKYKDSSYTFLLDARQLMGLSLKEIESIQDFVFLKISAADRAICLVSSLFLTIGNLNNAIEKRNKITEKFKLMTNKQEIMYEYFGLPKPNGDTNQEYLDLVKIISSSTDDTIFYSYLLCEDLHTHGNKVYSKFKKSFKSKSYGINRINFDQAKEEGMIPSSENYSTWFTSFKTAEK
ncbi:hypothetical protein [Nitrosomonas ureae]|nr:hypothetical protein [Nitrosomonas ureae]